MSLKDVHNAILEAIQGKVGEIKDIKSVSIGELTTLSPDKFPACYIILDRDEEADENVAKILHKFRTKVIIIIRSAVQDAPSGMAALVNLSADVHDKLLEDRTLGGACEILYFIARDFDYALGKDFHLFWSIITIEPWKAI